MKMDCFWFDALLPPVVRIKVVTRSALNCKYRRVFVVAFCVFHTQLPTLTSGICIVLYLLYHYLHLVAAML
jgi:hypothetical protein